MVAKRACLEHASAEPMWRRIKRTKVAAKEEKVTEEDLFGPAEEQDIAAIEQSAAEDDAVQEELLFGPADEEEYDGLERAAKRLRAT